MNEPIWLIDNGHGADTPGKCSPDAAAGMKDSPLFFREYKWCRERACDVCDVLQAQGKNAFLLVREEYDVPLATRVARVNAYCNRYGTRNVHLLSFHNNAYGDDGKWHNARGFSVYTTPGITPSDYLAESIHSAARDEFLPPLSVRKYSNAPLGADFEKSLYILRNVRCAGVLIEFFFQDNRKDVEYLLSDAGKGSCIEVVVKGIENYLAKYR